MDRLKVLVACGAYLFVGPTLIVLNKVILNELHFAFPMTLASLGNVASFLVCTALVHTGVVDLKNKAEVDRSFFLKKIMPIGAMSAGTLFFGNKVYLYLTVAFIQILKAFTPVVTMVVMFVAGLETPGLRLVLSVLGLAVGTSIAAYGELHFSLTGVLIMLSSEVAEAIKLVLQQILLRNLKFSVFESLYWISPASLLVMVLVIYAMEWQAMQDANAMDIVRSYPWHFMGSALLGFAVNTVSFFVIQVTSAVTLKVLAVARNAGLVLFCAVFLHESITLLEAFGYTVALSAFCYYNYLRMTAPKTKLPLGHPPHPPHTDPRDLEKGQGLSSPKPSES